MNIALPAFVVFLLVLPGFVFRARIKLAERQLPDVSPFGQVVVEGVVWAALLHALWIASVQALWPVQVRVDVALGLLSSDPGLQGPAMAHVGAQAGDVAGYFASLLAFAHAVPLAVRGAVTRWRLDRAASPLSGVFRFSRAPWYYLLSGADFAADEVPDLIAISAVVSVAGQPMLYTGILDEYFVDPEGRLDRLVLREVMRRPFARDKSPGADGREPDRFYRIDGDYFVLRYAEAVTLNVEYIKFAPPA